VLEVAATSVSRSFRREEFIVATPGGPVADQSRWGLGKVEGGGNGVDARYSLVLNANWTSSLKSDLEGAVGRRFRLRIR
jgi:hypothetical protein